MRLVTDLLRMQDPEQPHTLLTRVIVTLIILFASLVYAGFLGLLCAVGVYLLGVELMGLDVRWVYAPIVIAIVVGLTNAAGSLRDYWRNQGHG